MLTWATRTDDARQNQSFTLADLQQEQLDMLRDFGMDSERIGILLQSMHTKTRNRQFGIVIHLVGEWILVHDPTGDGIVSPEIAKLANMLGREFAWRNRPFRVTHVNSIASDVSPSWILENDVNWKTLVTPTNFGPDQADVVSDIQPGESISFRINRNNPISTLWEPRRTANAIQKLESLLDTIRTRIDAWEQRLSIA